MKPLATSPSQRFGPQQYRPPKLLLTFSLIFLALSLSAPLVQSQAYHFNRFPVPSSNYAVTVFRFFAYVPADPPALSIKSIPIGLTPPPTWTVPLFAYKDESGAKSRALGAGAARREDEIELPMRLRLNDGPNNDEAPERKMGGISFASQSEEDDEEENVKVAKKKAKADKAKADKKKKAEDDEAAAKERSEVESLSREAKPENITATLDAASDDLISRGPELITEIIMDNVFLDNRNLSPDLKDSVEVSLIRYDDFVTAFMLDAPFEAQPKFCCDQSMFNSGECSRVNRLIRPKNAGYFNSIPVGQPHHGATTFGLQLPTSDMYVLLISNCGPADASHATVSGSVYLRNYFGYLPGIDAPKTSVGVILAVFYVLLLIIFGVSAIRHRSQLIHIHGAIAAVLLMCLGEAIIWLAFYRYQNMQFIRDNIFFGCAIVFSVVKNIFAFILVLVASLGWGITKPHLSVSMKRKIYLLIISYVIFDSSRQLMTQFRLSHELSFLIVLSCILPVSLLHGIIFFWIFSSLSEVIEELKSKRQEIKLALFLRFWIVLLFTIVGAIAFLCVEVFVMSQEKPNNWKSDWIFTDVAPHSFFFLVLNSMIVLWAPSRNSRAMAYSSELPGEDAENRSGEFGAKAKSHDGFEAMTAQHAMGHLTDDDDEPETGKVEMTGTAATQEAKVWSKAPQQLQDLDFDDEEP